MTYTYDHNQPADKQVTEDLQLENFDWGFYHVDHERDSGTVDIAVIMRVVGQAAENSRVFQIPVPSAWDAASINIELLKLPAFAGSAPI